MSSGMIEVHLFSVSVLVYDKVLRHRLIFLLSVLTMSENCVT